MRCVETADLSAIAIKRLDKRKSRFSVLRTKAFVTIHRTTSAAGRKVSATGNGKRNNESQDCFLKGELISPRFNCITRETGTRLFIAEGREKTIRRGSGARLCAGRRKKRKSALPSSEIKRRPGPGPSDSWPETPESGTRRAIHLLPDSATPSALRAPFRAPRTLCAAFFQLTIKKSFLIVASDLMKGRCHSSKAMPLSPDACH